MANHHQKPKQLSLFSSMARVGPLAAMCLLELWLQHKVIMTEDDLEELTHIIIDALTEARDERFRCQPEVAEPEGPSVY